MRPRGSPWQSGGHADRCRESYGLSWLAQDGEVGEWEGSLALMAAALHVSGCARDWGREKVDFHFCLCNMFLTYL